MNKSKIRMARGLGAGLAMAAAATLAAQGSEQIMEIERQLQALDYDPGKVDGVFDQDLVNALNAFKANRGAAVAGKRAAAAPVGVEPLPYLREVEQRLAGLNFNPGPVDGIADQRLVDAINAFKAKQGLPADGLLDRRTYAALSDASEQLPVIPAPIPAAQPVAVAAAPKPARPVIVATPPRAPAPVPVGSGQLAPDGSPYILGVERTLSARGFDPGKQDGIFDESLTKAISSFKASQGLPADGVLDTATRKLLAVDDTPAAVVAVVPPTVTSVAPAQAPVAAPASVAAPAPVPTVAPAAPAPKGKLAKEGSPYILEVEQKLAAMGFDPGALDGVFDSRLEQAISAFQSKQGLRSTGYLDDATRAALNG